MTAKERLHRLVDELTDAEASEALIALEQRVPEATRKAAEREGISLSAWLNQASVNALAIKDGLAGVAEWEAELGRSPSSSWPLPMRCSTPRRLAAGVQARYAKGVVLDKETRAMVATARRELAEATPEQNSRTAVLLREVSPKLTSQRQRDIAEDMAKRFEERAAARSMHSARS